MDEDLTSYLLRTSEDERAALAKELHDELGGLITAAKMDMATLSSRLGDSLDAESADKFKSVMQMLNQAMILKRRVVENLRPSLLDHFGLAVALRSHLEERCAEAGIECITSIAEEPLELAQLTQLTLFRVAQEALTGIIGSGGARHLEVVLEPEGEGYVMTIGDDGSPRDGDLSRSMPSVRHRVKGLGGRIDAEARATQGNRLRIFVPKSA
jgi:signal transduction histidine kinase